MAIQGQVVSSQSHRSSVNLFSTSTHFIYNQLLLFPNISSYNPAPNHISGVNLLDSWGLGERVCFWAKRPKLEGGWIHARRGCGFTAPGRHILIQDPGAKCRDRRFLDLIFRRDFCFHRSRAWKTMQAYLFDEGTRKKDEDGIKHMDQGFRIAD